MTLAVVVTLLLIAAFLVSWRWRPRRPVKPEVWMLLISYAVLGAWALWFGLYSEPDKEPSRFMFWKPTILYWTLSIISIVAPLLRFDYPIKTILGTYFAFSTREWRWLNRGFAVAFGLLGGINLLIAFASSEADWVGFKFSCMVLILFVILFRLSFVWVETAGRMASYLYGRAKAFFQ